LLRRLELESLPAVLTDSILAGMLPTKFSNAFVRATNVLSTSLEVVVVLRLASVKQLATVVAF
jgi:hypothetical protein